MEHQPDLDASSLAVLHELGFDAPTPIQAQAIPTLLAGKDVLAQSSTGSGKTLAFSIPLVARVQAESARVVQGLVLCPTRELCAQVARELRRVARRHAGLQVLILTGGAPMGPQLAALERGAHVVVGTPGRVLDHLRRGRLQLSAARSVVLDEADRMLEMGFQEAVEEILSHTSADRQTVLFSATYPRAIEALSAQYQREPVHIRIAAAAATELLEQRYQLVTGAKPEALVTLLLATQHDAALVFADQKLTVIELERTLRDAGFSVGAWHGDMEQVDRDVALAKFRNGSTRVLLATNVAARGIDIGGLELVVNYDLPTRFDVYAHRVGRTGRAGNTGIAISLVKPFEEPRVQAIAAALGTTISKLDEADPQLPRATGAPVPAAMQTLRIWGGRRDKLRPGDILGALTGEEVGLAGSEIGKIEIHDRVAFVAVRRERGRHAHRALAAGRLKARRFRVDLLD